VLAGNAPFYAPANNRPCVYYHIVVREERRRVRFETIRDQAGNERTEERIENYWIDIANEERTSDFYLQDGMYKVFVQGSNRGQTKVQGTPSAGGNTNYFTIPPPGIQWFPFF
jgi:hypothetical protein